MSTLICYPDQTLNTVPEQGEDVSFEAVFAVPTNVDPATLTVSFHPNVASQSGEVKHTVHPSDVEAIPVHPQQGLSQASVDNLAEGLGVKLVSFSLRNIGSGAATGDVRVST